MACERVFHYEHPAVDRRNVLLVPFAGGWRVDLQCREEDDPDEFSSPAGVRRWLPRVVDPRCADDVRWVSTYRFLQVLADRFTDEHHRVLLVGEAAHLFAPFGARGMNSGIADAASAAEAVATAWLRDGPSGAGRRWRRQRPTGGRRPSTTGRPPGRRWRTCRRAAAAAAQAPVGRGGRAPLAARGAVAGHGAVRAARRARGGRGEILTSSSGSAVLVVTTAMDTRGIPKSGSRNCTRSIDSLIGANISARMRLCSASLS